MATMSPTIANSATAQVKACMTARPVQLAGVVGMNPAMPTIILFKIGSTNTMAINSRTKGASAEREFSNEIYQWSGIRLIRNLEQTRSGGVDLVVHPDETGEVADAFRILAIECKRYRAVTPGLIKTWWQQARDQAKPNLLHPVLAYRADRQDWQVIAPLYLVNPGLTRNLNLDCTVTMAVSAFCSIVREVGLG
jgi:hypothetical protein